MDNRKSHILYEKKSDLIWLALFVFLYVLTGALCYRLYLRQAIVYPGKMGTYLADIGSHIHEGVRGRGYSLMELYYGLVVGKLGLSEKPAAAFVSLLTIGTVFVTYRFMRKIAPACSRNVLHLASFFSIFLFPLYIPSLNGMRYLGLQSGANWHNDTYTGMRFAAMLLFLFYYTWINCYRERFGWKDFTLFTILLILVNWIKPNFIVAFAPAMALMLLADCIRDRGNTIKMQILFGIPVLISLLVLLYQANALFGGSSSGSSTSSGLPIGFSVAYVLKLRAQHPVASLLQSAAFPLYVMIGNRRELKKDRFLQITWLTWLVGLLEFLFIHEEGKRKGDGNLSWGYSFCIYLVFTVSTAWFCRNWHQFLSDIREDKCSFGVFVRKDKANVRRLIYLVLGSGLFLYHLYSGLAFFYYTLQGAPYAI